MIPKTSSRSRVKKGPWRSEKYKRWVKENHGCLICGNEAHDAHHIREMLPRTMGVQKGDMWVVPLCATHHDLLHRGAMKFWRGSAFNPIAWCVATYARWQKETGHQPPARPFRKQ
jgi:hypothetical protein